MNHLTALRTKAISEAAAWISEEHPGAKLVSHRDIIEALAADETLVWSPLSITESEGVSLSIELDARFPFSLPRFRINGPDDPRLRPPHVESGGRLCLAGSGATFDANQPVELLIHQFNEARQLIIDNANGRNDHDYRSDFYRYWLHSLNSNEINYDILPIDFSGNDFISFIGKPKVIAESVGACEKWLQWRTGQAPQKTRSGIHIVLNGLPVPKEYPVDGASCREMLQLYAPEDVKRFDGFCKLVAEEKRDGFVIFSYASVNREGVRVGGVLKIPPRRSGHGNAAEPIMRGFKNVSRIPGAVLASRLSFERINLVRPDQWKARHLEEFEGLDDRRVLLIGCGSIGGGVAKILYQSGIRNIDLVDPERLGWENLGRHVLGAPSVGEPKATALATELQRQIEPWNEVTGHVEDAISFLNKSQGSDLSSYSLAICLTGDWSSEQAISKLLAAEPSPCQVLFGWLEPYGQAAHAVLLDGVGPCFECGFDPLGNLLLPITVWDQEINTPCYENTSIYSAAAAAPAQYLISSLALDVLTAAAQPPIHRVWVGHRDEIERLGGQINPGWERLNGALGSGMRFVPADWGNKPGCGCQM